MIEKIPAVSPTPRIHDESSGHPGAGTVRGLPFRVGGIGWGARMLMNYPLARIPLICSGALAVCAFILGGIYDLRFVIVGCMLLLLVLPMLLGLLFLSYGLLPVNSLNIPLHRLKVGAAGIEVQMLETTRADGQKTSDKEHEQQEKNIDDEPRVVRSCFLPASSFRGVELWGSGIWLSVEMEGKIQYLAVLRRGFREEDYNEVQDMLLWKYSPWMPGTVHGEGKI